MKRRILPWLLAGNLMLTLPGCGAGDAVLAGKSPVMPESASSAVEADERLTAVLAEFSAESGEALLLGQENLCYAPVSLYYALALAGTGAAGETQQEIYALLGCSDAETLSDDLETLYRALYRDEKHCKVYLANSVWMREGVAFYEGYTDNAAKRFYAECYTMNFDAPKAGRTISDWVSDKTKGLLKPEVTLKPETIAVLLNAVYFKANWIDEFQKKYTEQAAFTRADGSDVLCDFMQDGRSGRAVAAEGYCLAAIPFDGGFEMFFLLPDEGESIDGLVMSRDLAELLDESAAEYRMVEWRVPKFTVQSQLDLVPVLRKLGVEQAFSDTAADFSAMCDVQQLGGPAYIGAVEQGVSFSIDEEGAEAAAYTEIAVGAGSPAPPEETIVMDLNRPFLYGVRDDQGTILFLGRCDDPAAR